MTRLLPFVSIVVALVLGTAGAARADVAAAVQAFDAGNSHYSVGNYQAAVEAYQQALAEGYASAALFYNLGNAYFRLDEIGEAIRAYERARLLAPDDSEIRHNLAIAQEHAVDKFSRLPSPYWQRAWVAIIRSVGPWPLFAAGILLWVLGAAAAIQWTLRGPGSAWLRRGLTISGLAGAVLLVAAFSASVSREQSVRGVVLAEEVDLMSEPSPSASTEITVHEGVVVDLLRRRDEWRLVQLPNGARGWAPERAIGEISL